MEALNDLVQAGKVRALGASAMYGYQFYNMQLAAKEHGWAQFQAMENHYNLLYREDERELIPICKQMGVSLMPYSPLAAGHLARPTWNGDTCRSKTDRVAMGKYDRTEEQDMKIVARVAELADLWRKDAADCTGMALGERRCIAHRRCNEVRLPGRCCRRTCSPVDRRGRGIPGRTICAAPNRRCDRPQPGRGRYAAG